MAAEDFDRQGVLDHALDGAPERRVPWRRPQGHSEIQEESDLRVALIR
jgi:hypothetical protein